MKIPERQLSTLSQESLLTFLKSNQSEGLSHEEAATRLSESGPNEIGKRQAKSAWFMLASQFTSSVVLLLIAATIISLLMHEYLQTLGILVVLLANAAIGFVTEYRAGMSLASLSKISGATIRVRRGGVETNLPVRELVQGDIVLLSPGARIPADLRLLESANFSVDESPLTGESVAVWKSADSQLSQNAQSALVYQGSSALSGRATGVVLATGGKTKLGRLGRLLEETASGETPLTRSLNILGHQLTVLVLFLSAVFCLLGMHRHIGLERMLETSIALAVAAIPDGLPLVATFALAQGLRRMVEAKAIVRRLAAVETLGCTNVICTDKTGTLTENKMLVTNIVLLNDELKLSGRGYEPSGNFSTSQAEPESLARRLDQFLKAICLCNDARLEIHDGDEGWHIHGDPTEGCLITACLKLGLDDDKARKTFPRLAELPFDLRRKRMSTIHFSEDDGCLLFCKGSPETVLPLCSSVLGEEGELCLTQDQRRWFEKQNIDLAEQGLRVLAVAMRKMARVPDSLDQTELETNLTLLGLVAMADRPKENVKEAIKTCKSAGIQIVMLTGDQPATAKAVANELGITRGQETEAGVITGDKLARLNDAQQEAVLSQVSVLARVAPEMKLNIVKRLQEAGNIVAMTGDGINDAPAMRQSNIGVAMGQSGTDMAREAADLVITDDNFATIVKAIEQGRITYENICRAIGYLLTASMAAVIAITMGLLANSGLFLQPLQLLYMNLIMHVLPGLGIILQRNSKGIMRRPPRSQTEGILNKYEQTQIIARSIIVAIVSLAAITLDQAFFGAESATTVGLAILSLALILQSWSWLSTDGNGQGVKWYRNKPMLFCTAINIFLLLIAIYFAPFRLILNTTALDPGHLTLVLAAAFATYLLSMPIRAWGKAP